MNKHYTAEQITMTYTKGELIQRLQQIWLIVKGSMFLGGEYPFALDVKGGE